MTRRLARSRLALVSAVTLAALVPACAGSPPAPPPAPPPPPSLCELDQGAGGAPDGPTWIALLLRGYDPTSRRVTVPALDCTGAQVRWSGPALQCEDGALGRTPLPERPLEAGDVVSSAVSPVNTLVWIPTSRFTSGDALGPVALVESRGTRLRVLALGPLRAYPNHARLRLEPLGDRTVLVAEGDACASADPMTCVRAARLVSLRGERFVPEPLVGETGGCVSPAWLELSRRDQRQVDGRWERAELGATLRFGGAALAVDEQVVIQDLGAKPGSAPARLLHRAEATRTVRAVADRLVVSGDALWPRMRRPAGTR